MNGYVTIIMRLKSVLLIFVAQSVPTELIVGELTEKTNWKT